MSGLIAVASRRRDPFPVFPRRRPESRLCALSLSSRADRDLFFSDQGVLVSSSHAVIQADGDCVQTEVSGDIPADERKWSIPDFRRLELVGNGDAWYVFLSPLPHRLQDRAEIRPLAGKEVFRSGRIVLIELFRDEASRF